MSVLLYLKDPVDILIDIMRRFDLNPISRRSMSIGLPYRRSQVQHRLPSNKRFLMVVLDFNINNMYGLVEFAAPTEQICVVYHFNESTSCTAWTHHRILRQNNAPRM